MTWLLLIWCVALMLLAGWSLLFWLAAQVWAIVAAQSWPDAVEQLRHMQLPPWLAPWIGDWWGEWIVAAEPWLEFLARHLRSLGQAFDGVVPLLLWAGWGFGAALLLLVALLASALVWWSRRPPRPPINAAGVSA